MRNKSNVGCFLIVLAGFFGLMIFLFLGAILSNYGGYSPEQRMGIITVLGLGSIFSVLAIIFGFLSMISKNIYGLILGIIGGIFAVLSGRLILGIIGLSLILINYNDYTSTQAREYKEEKRIGRQSRVDYSNVQGSASFFGKSIVPQNPQSQKYSQPQTIKVSCPRCHSIIDVYPNQTHIVCQYCGERGTLGQQQTPQQQIKCGNCGNIINVPSYPRPIEVVCNYCRAKGILH